MCKHRYRDKGTAPVGRVICAALLLAAAVGAWAKDTGDGAFHDVFMVMYSSQEQLLGPDAMVPGPGDRDYFDLFGIYGTVHGIKTLLSRDEDLMVADALRSAVGSFDFESLTEEIFAAVEVESDWVVWDTSQDIQESRERSTATRIFRETPVDYVLVVEANYFMSPGLDQLRGIVRVRLMGRPEETRRPTSLFTRNFEYLSPSVGDVMRPFRAGEKEALVQEIEADYARLAEEDPDNAAIYANEQSEVLEQLSRRDVILPERAIAEAWPGRSLVRGLGDMRRHLQHMILTDLRVLVGPVPEEGEVVRFARLDKTGEADTGRGRRIGTFDGNTIYRDKGGDMYSLP